MKGIVFNLLEEVVRREYGEDTWDALLDGAHLSGTYTSLGSYADEDLFKLVAVASSTLQTPAGQIVRWFGRSALPLLAEKYPEFFRGHQSTRPFLLTLNDIIHPEVRKLYPGADVPVFGFDTSSQEVLLMEYRSARKLCAFAEGLIEGAAAHYGEEVAFDQPKCMNRGDEYCVFRMSFRNRQQSSMGEAAR
jgi:hypothetical protein